MRTERSPRASLIERLHRVYQTHLLVLAHSKLCAPYPYLTGEVLSQEDVSGRQIAVNKPLPGQVVHPVCYLVGEAQQHVWGG